jgi:hypothetical protein
MNRSVDIRMQIRWLHVVTCDTLQDQPEVQADASAHDAHTAIPLVIAPVIPPASSRSAEEQSHPQVSSPPFNTVQRDGEADPWMDTVLRMGFSAYSGGSSR